MATNLGAKEDGFFDEKSRDDMQKLFLLEVLVDSLSIETASSSANLNKELAENMTDTCVMFQFLHYPPLVVCESDFIGTAVSNKDTSNITFKSGKSCFFSLRTPKGPILPVPFDVKVSVVRKMKEGVLPDKLEVGKTNIDLGESFTELLKQNTDENFCEQLPISKTQKGTFEIKDDAGKKVGSLTAFLRLSCFGKLIITQFSLNKEDEKTYLFKGTDLKELCKNDLGQLSPQKTNQAAGEGQKRQSIVSTTKKDGYCYCNTPGQGPGAITDTPPHSSGSPSKQGQVETFDPKQGPQPPKGGGYQTGYHHRGLGGQGGFPLRGPEPPKGGGYQTDYYPGGLGGQGPGPTRAGGYPTDYYPGELGGQGPGPTRAGGYPMGYSQRGPEPPRGGGYPTDFYKQGPQPPRGVPVKGGRLCDCPYPVPPDIMAQVGKGGGYPQGSGRNLNLAPGEVGMQDDQVIFQLPLKKPGDPLSERDKQIDSQVYYKLTSAEETKDGVQKNTVNVKSDDLPGMATKQVSPVSGLPVDDGHDVFLLKIGKKCEGDKKRNLELELRTPKMKEPKPAMSDRDTQYLESDIPKPSKDKVKGGKGGKGSKGKAGKKGKK